MSSPIDENWSCYPLTARQAEEQSDYKYDFRMDADRKMLIDGSLVSKDAFVVAKSSNYQRSTKLSEPYITDLDEGLGLPGPRDAKTTTRKCIGQAAGNAKFQTENIVYADLRSGIFIIREMDGDVANYSTSGASQLTADSQLNPGGPITKDMIHYDAVGMPVTMIVAQKDFDLLKINNEVVETLPGNVRSSTSAKKLIATDFSGFCGFIGQYDCPVVGTYGLMDSSYVIPEGNLVDELFSLLPATDMSELCKSIISAVWGMDGLREVSVAGIAKKAPEIYGNAAVDGNGNILVSFRPSYTKVFENGTGTVLDTVIEDSTKPIYPVAPA